MGYNFFTDNTGLSSFVYSLAIVGSKICQIPPNSEKIRIYSRSRYPRSSM